MKRSDNDILSIILLCVAPVLLIVPNIALDITEQYSGAVRIANIAIPLGVYIVLLSAWRRNSITALCLIPIAVLAAFQIVLLFLYGESIIAIDMFLNVVTTNTKEASELLMNLGGAILIVCLIYLPYLVLSIVALCKKSRLTTAWRNGGVGCGAAFLFVGIVAALCQSGYRPTRELFPLNVCSNIGVAAERTVQSKNYLDTSEDFDFHSRCLTDSAKDEIYVMVIGETSRADNWQLNGYDRDTNPRLSHRKSLIFCRQALSESNTTHKSVPLMLSCLGADQFADSIFHSRSIIDCFRQAGFETSFFSNQQRNGSLIDFMGLRADNAEFLADDGCAHYDMELCEHLKKALDDNSNPHKFIVLHTYGSHFNYNDRYPADMHYFGSKTDGDQANAANRQALIDAYDNTIRYTDAVLDSIISIVKAKDCAATVVYASDHGEDIYDDSRERFLHASPTPTYYQLHVPMFVWFSERYKAENQDRYVAVKANMTRRVSSSRALFHTIVDLAKIQTPYLNRADALDSDSYKEPEAIYLNDYNEGVALRNSGFRQPDFRALASM